MSARSEPLLWVQLIGAGLFPLEALLLLLLLAGSDPGPVPSLERLLCWALGALAPSLLLWRRPADVWSLLLLQTPLRARRPLQQRLSRLQEGLPLRLALALGTLLSLPLLWWLDAHAGIASALSPLAGTPRLVVLLLAALWLAVMLWQWQQLLQALWLLSRPGEQVEAALPMGEAELEASRLSLGLPLLLLDPLRLEAAAVPPARPTPSPAASSVVEVGAAAASAAGDSSSADLTAHTAEERVEPAAAQLAARADAAGAGAPLPATHPAPAAEAVPPQDGTVSVHREPGPDGIAAVLEVASPAAADPGLHGDGQASVISVSPGDAPVVLQEETTSTSELPTDDRGPAPEPSEPSDGPQGFSASAQSSAAEPPDADQATAVACESGDAWVDALDAGDDHAG